MAAELLTDKKIGSAKPTDKIYTLRDGNGLFVLIHPNGSKYFQLRSTIHGKPKLIQIGTYGNITLSDARDKARELKKQISGGKDPIIQKKIAKASSKMAAQATFESVYLDWLTEKSYLSASYLKKIKTTFKANVIPRIGQIPANEINAPLIKGILRVMEERGCIELTRKTQSWLKEVLNHATSNGLRTGDNPAAVVKIHTPRVIENYPTLNNRFDVGDFMRKIMEYGGRVETGLAIQLLMLTAVRPGDLRLAKWNEFNLTHGTWNIPKERTKMRRSHTVMLSRQAVMILEELKRLTDYQEFLLPDLLGKKPISNGTLIMALRRLWPKYRIVPHGFRSLFSTHANDSRLFHKDIIEFALAHGDENQIRGTYNLAEYRTERARLAQWWADELDAMRDGAKVLPYRSIAS